MQYTCDKSSSEGVSPIIGIILMVAVCVALVAFATLIVFDVGENVEEPATGYSVSTETQEQNDKVLVTVSRNPNLNRIFLRGEGIDGEQEIVDSEGNTGTVQLSPSSSDGTIEVVGATEGGDEQILDTSDYEGFSGSGSGETKSEGGNGGGVFTNDRITEESQEFTVDLRHYKEGSYDGNRDRADAEFDLEKTATDGIYEYSFGDGGSGADQEDVPFFLGSGTDTTSDVDSMEVRNPPSGVEIIKVELGLNDDSILELPESAIKSGELKDTEQLYNTMESADLNPKGNPDEKFTVRVYAQES